MEAHGKNSFMARKKRRWKWLQFEIKFIEARKTRTETKENKTKQPRRALKIQSLPSASGKWITYAWYDWISLFHHLSGSILYETLFYELSFERSLREQKLYQSNQEVTNTCIKMLHCQDPEATQFQKDFQVEKALLATAFKMMRRKMKIQVEEDNYFFQIILSKIRPSSCMVSNFLCKPIFCLNEGHRHFLPFIPSVF